MPRPTKINITIDLGNSGMQNPLQVAALLVETAQRLSNNGFRDMKLRDINGNTVGELSLETPDA